MIQLPEDRRPPLTPQLALRVAVVGSIALAMFAIIFFRLWFLQVLSGDQYLAQASTNKIRSLAVAAPRGEIRDRNGTLLVNSKPSIAVQLSPPDLPKSPPELRRLYRRLAGVLGMSPKRINCPVTAQKVVGGILEYVHEVFHQSKIACDVTQQVTALPYADVTVKLDVSPDVQYYLAERQEQFPGVSVKQVWLRQYPLHDIAAQLFGTVGRITLAELHDRHYRGASQNSVVGQSGLEYYYDGELRGTDGLQRLQIDAFGRFKGYLRGRSPIQGNTLKLSLDLQLQRAGEQALSEAIANNPPAPAGAFIALNPTNGQVYAMGSNPTFDPNIFTKPLTQSQYQSINNASSGYPLFNRAIQSAYPTGSTFKGITATAALQSGVWNTSDTYDDTGSFQDSPGVFRHNAGHAAYGTLDLTSAIQVSSDNFFYNLGRLLNSDKPAGGALQYWAHQFGIGRKTGIDLGGENSGILPSPEWRASRNTLEAQCDNLTHPTKLFPNHPHHKLAPGACGIADGTNRPWSSGDNENLAVGQGDLEATPLQLAVAYSAIENGGTVVRPHVGMEIDAPDGSVVQRINPPAQRHLQINPSNLKAITDGLHAAASQAGGTSADVFAGWPQDQYPVYGKTGTAQRGILADQSWYVCYVPDPVKPILVVVTVEQGGFGAQAAAPAAREILSQWFFGKRGKFVAGTSKTL